MIKSNSFNRRNLSPPRLMIPNILNSSREKKLSKRSRERRWTTGLEKGQLSLSFNHDPLVADDNSIRLSQDTTTDASLMSLTSWASSTSDFDTGSTSDISQPLRSTTPTPEHHFSQQDVLQELQHQHLSKSLEAETNHQYQLSYELAVDNSPLSPSTYGPSTQVTQCLYVIRELLTTEWKYIADLTDIIEGYHKPFTTKVGYLLLTEEDVSNLFGNIEEIRAFHRTIFDALQHCGHDYQKIGQCFIDKAEGFKIYTLYCNNYPRLIQTLAKISTDKSISRFMKNCQQRLNHLLPLGAYLLKPVQRVLKYSLLLQELVKHMTISDHGLAEMKLALDYMNSIAGHINETKKRYDAAVYTQEIQSLLTGWEGPELTTYGDIVLQDGFRVMLNKTGSLRPAHAGFKNIKDAHVFLFQRLILIVKKKDEGYQYKHCIEVADAQLTEHLKDPTCFQIRQISSKSTITFQAKSADQKQLWGDSIKRLLMESLPGLPDKARQLIMAGFTTDLRAGNTYHNSPKSFTLDRKHFKKDDRSESPSKNVARTISLIPTSTKQTSPVNVKAHPPVKPVISLVQAGLGTGFLVGSASATNTQSNGKKDNNVQVPESPSGAKKSGKVRIPHGIPWTRSDSDPNLMDGYEQKQPDVKNLPSSLASSPISRLPGTSNLSRPSPLETSPLATPTSLEPSRSSVSPPDLKRKESTPPPPPPVPTLEIVAGMDVSEHQPPPSSPLFFVSPPIRDPSPTGLPPPSPPPSQPPLASSLISIAATTAAAANHSRSKSAPMKEPYLETIYSIENTPRNSIIDATTNERTGTGPSSPLPTVIVQSVGDETCSDSSPLMKMRIKQKSSSLSNDSPIAFPQSDKGVDDDVIPVQLGTEVSTIGNGDIVLEPPPSFGAEPIVTQYMLDTRQAKRENEESERNELLFEELMSMPSLSSAPPTSYDLNEKTIEDQTLMDVLSQPQDDIEDELTPRESGESPIISIEPPTEFQSTGRENGGGGSSPGKIASRLKLVSSDDFALPVIMNYTRQTTPYTSIEDMPSLFDDEVLPDTPTTPVFPPPPPSPPSSPPPQSSLPPRLSPLPVSPPPPPDTLTESDENVNSSSSPSNNVRRWHSFHGEKNKRVFRSMTDHSMSTKNLPPPAPTSPKKEKKEKLANKSESAGKLGFLRHRSFGKSHATHIRPISLVGLVHSTRDDSDLVDLSDAIEMNRRHKAQTPDYILPPPEFRGEDEDEAATSPESTIPSPPLSVSSSTSSTTKRKLSTEGNNDRVTSPLNSSTSSTGGGIKKNRWSLLRSKISSGSSTNTTTTTSGIGSSSKQEDEVNADLSPPQLHLRIHSDDANQPVDERATSLFSVESSDTRRRGKQGKDKRRGGGGETATSAADTHDLTVSVPASVNERRHSRVQNMAREYSKRIKKQSPSEAVAATSSNSNETDSAPNWVRALVEKRRQRSNTAATGRRGRHRNRDSVLSQSEADDELMNNPGPLTPTSIHSEMPGFHSPPAFDSPPMTPDPQWGLVPSQSFSVDCYRGDGYHGDGYHGDEDWKTMTERPSSTDPKLTKSTHSNLQRFSSETVLSQSTEEEKEKSPPKRNGRQQKKGNKGRGWVRSLVSKFNSNK